MKKYWLRYFRRRYPQRWPRRALRSALHMATIPTRFGLATFLTLVAMFVWSANHQIGLGFALTFFVVVVLTLSAGTTARQLSALELSAAGGPGVFAGEEALFHIHVHNPGPEPRHLLQLRSGRASALIAEVAPGQAASASLFIPTRRRGRLPLDVLEVSTVFPFGLFHSWQWLLLDAEVLVYPSPRGQLPLPLAPAAQAGAQSLGTAGEEELSQLRPYVIGDSLARVAWKHVGRGEWLLKQFSGSGAAQVLLAYEHTSGPLETRLSQLAQWIEEARRQGLRYGLRLPHGEIPPGSDEAHRERCLRALALFEEQLL